MLLEVGPQTDEAEQHSYQQHAGDEARPTVIPVELTEVRWRDVGISHSTGEELMVEQLPGLHVGLVRPHNPGNEGEWNCHQSVTFLEGTVEAGVSVFELEILLYRGTSEDRGLVCLAVTTLHRSQNDIEDLAEIVQSLLARE